MNNPCISCHLRGRMVHYMLMLLDQIVCCIVCIVSLSHLLNFMVVHGDEVVYRIFYVFKFFHRYAVIVSKFPFIVGRIPRIKSDYYTRLDYIRHHLCIQMLGNYDFFHIIHPVSIADRCATIVHDALCVY